MSGITRLKGSALCVGRALGELPRLEPVLASGQLRARQHVLALTYDT
jgi:hypothetical protein